MKKASVVIPRSINTLLFQHKNGRQA